MWVTSTQSSLASLIEQLACLVPDSYLEIACLDSCLDRRTIIESTFRFKGRDTIDAEYFHLATWAKSGAAFSLTGYDEVWLYLHKPNKVNRRDHSLQEFGSDWDLKQDNPPAEFLKTFEDSGALLIISDCALRNIVTKEKFVFLPHDQWRELGAARRS